MKSLILGTALNYNYSQLQSFLKSLQATSYSGDVVFFVSGTTEETNRKLIEAGVTIIPFTRRKNGLVNSWGRFWQKISWIFALPLSTSFKALIIREITHFMYFRFFLYYNFLRFNYQKYNLVLMTDLRDVYFQDNPFAKIMDENKLMCFQENPHVAIKDCTMNSEWLSTILGSNAIKDIGHLPILCAGTIMGSVETVLEFLEIFIHWHGRIQILHPNGDQALLNYIVYQIMSKDKIAIFPNNRGSVFTMSSLPKNLVNTNNEGNVIDADGNLIPILHQYDRHPILAKKLVSNLA